jgi:hypothetical protein
LTATVAANVCDWIEFPAAKVVYRDEANFRLVEAEPLFLALRCFGVLGP